MNIPVFSGVMQWLHVLAAVLAVGGVFFLRFILCPALKKLSPEQEATKAQLLQSVVRGFKMVIHSSIAVLIITGVIRLLNTWSQLKAMKGYIALLHTKLLLAVVLFVIAIMLTLPGSPPNYFQRNRDKWLLVNFVLGAIIILLSAIMRRMWDAS